MEEERIGRFDWPLLTENGRGHDPKNQISF
jgi:hypothetical protein